MDILMLVIGGVILLVLGLGWWAWASLTQEEKDLLIGEWRDE